MKKNRQKNFTMGKWGRSLLLLVFVPFVLLSGCQKKEEPGQEQITVEIPEGVKKLYVLNEERTKVISENFEPVYGAVDEKISAFLEGKR